jgi:hypothetical protein
MSMDPLVDDTAEPSTSIETPESAEPEAEATGDSQTTSPEPPITDREASLTALAAELAERTTRLAAAERTASEAVRDRELAAGLADYPLVRGAVGQLLKLLRDDLETTPEGRVRTRDGRAVPVALADWLSRPEYAHFRLPASRGGSAVAGGGSGRAGRGADEPFAASPKNLGEAAILRWRAAASGPGGLESPIGLGRRRSR